MRSGVRLASGPGFVVHAVTCVDDHRGWSPVEVGSAHQLVLVRRGRFRRMADGRGAVVDPAMAYLSLPGQEERFAHPAGGDVCTVLRLTPRLWDILAGGRGRPARSTLYVDARLDLAHRRLLAATGSGDPAYELTEALLPLLATALDRAAPPPSVSGGSRRTGPTAGTLVDAAREAIASGHEAAGGLVTLAELLSVSPYRLSRAFTSELGVSLTHYRNRVRVGRALDRLEAGEESLARLAADLGFADQAHLTRTIRHHCGHTPAVLRRLLSRAGVGPRTPPEAGSA
ncbi:AraC family transcriptional regulator [Nonomuraea rhodomycinica]|uniref:Helix-turn-helix transcriptional regulator n=1 Tax=Nonomuraea rhodomycinica TaxID=1712872 RepID=A0A7Y6MA00_9ACTN|nr:AraC family transcriptional regulator [Nonomuraea rhodomycinica]NUW38944.1 helix-turn-helix transcriptional regulator [Nonomuraea rhodomycinica]